ncbi:hypothetical protein QAD02_006185 [Eretmocerus hayati]|uniref:Uncharacterized protein n=1 Tax=Eretmocerus hayati TaxID=131215 RepID=A0ACC2N098_9HYME|nr:hypothetical protein QAD02_006185 [Eretmocerus hayati]
MVNAVNVQMLKDQAQKLRIHSLKSTEASKSGHPTSCSSMAEIMSVLFYHVMRYKISAPRDPSSDRFILSKGHAAPILYAAWAEAGLFPTKELLNLRQLTSDLEGHPTPRLNFVDVATGSLGQGLSVAAGMAYVGKYFDKASYRTYCLIGDGESAEGSIWEALSFASHYKLDNLCAIFDINRLGQSEPTALQHNMEVYRKRVEAFGFNAIVVDGHDVEELVKAFHEAENTKGRPTAIIAKTFKGKNFPSIEDLENWHGKAITGAQGQDIIKHIQSLTKGHGQFERNIPKPIEDAPKVDITNVKLDTPPNYKLGLDGDTKNSTFADKIKGVDAKRFVEGFIAEQNIVGVAIGAACRDRTVAFVSAFAAFFSRAYDQIRMGAISQTNVNFVGSHCGVSIGEDGPSQMALEDLAMFRAIPGSTVFYPSDAVSTERAAELAANTKGICFIRTSRPNTPVIYANDEPLAIGKAKIVRSSGNDQALLIGAGITLHESLKAADILAKSGIHVRVMDPFTIKPIDKKAIIDNAVQTSGRIITVEDHYPEGGLGEAVLSAISEHPNLILRKIAVNEVPRSGKPEELLQMFGIDAQSIAKTTEDFIKN